MRFELLFCKPCLEREVHGEAVLWEVYWTVVLTAFVLKRRLAPSDRFGPWTWEMEFFRCGEGGCCGGTIPALNSIQIFVEQKIRCS